MNLELFPVDGELPWLKLVVSLHARLSFDSNFVNFSPLL